MYMNVTLTVSSQGQIVIPVKVRKALGVIPGSKVTLTLTSTQPIPTVTLQPEPKSWVKQVAGTGQGLWGNAEEYIKKERDPWDEP